MKRMRVVTVILVALAVVMAGTTVVLAVETIFIWTGEASTLWSIPGNWDQNDGFPSEGDHDAVFEPGGGLETVNLVTEGIRHLTVDGTGASGVINLVFDSNAGGGNTVTCRGDILFIAPSGHDMKVLVSDSAKITHH